MRENFKEFVFVIEKSDALLKSKAAVIEGFNAIVDAQKKNPNPSAFSLFFFNDEVKMSASGKLFSEMRKYNSKTYSPKGRSAMYDAISVAIDSVGERLSETKEEDRPDKVFVIALSFGDNASTICPRSVLAEKIALQTYTYNWGFAFFGQGNDELGISQGFSLPDASELSIKKAFEAINDLVSQVRG